VLFSSIFFLAGGLGVLNTMLMATYERIPEFGIVKALGTPPWHLLRDVTLEALLLAVAASLMGLLLGGAGNWLLATHGLNTAGVAGGETTIVGVAFDPVWRASPSLSAAVRIVIVMWTVCVAAAFYPAWLAARCDPVRSIYHGAR